MTPSRRCSRRSSIAPPPASTRTGPTPASPPSTTSSRRRAASVAITGWARTRRTSCRRWSPTRPPGMALVNAVLAALLPSRAHRPRPICRSADAGDDDRLRAGGASGRARPSSRRRRRRLCTASSPAAASPRRPRTAISAFCPTLPTAGSRSSKRSAAPISRALPLLPTARSATRNIKKSTPLLAEITPRAPRRNG